MSDLELSERPPTEQEASQASAAARLLASALSSENGLKFDVSRAGNHETIALPPAVGQLVLDLLTHIGRGEMVTFLPYGAELSTKEAADILNVSRPFLINLLRDGHLPFHKVGSHRRIKANDLLDYKDRRSGERRKALEELQRLGQEFDAS